MLSADIKAKSDIRWEDVFAITRFMEARKRGLPEDEAMVEAIDLLYREVLRYGRKTSKKPMVELTRQGKIDLYIRMIERIGEIFYINALRPEIRKYLERDIDYVDFCDVIRAKFNR